MIRTLGRLFLVGTVVFLGACSSDSANEDRELISNLRLNDDLVQATNRGSMLDQSKACAQRIRRTNEAGVEFIELSRQACPGSGLAEKGNVVATLKLKAEVGKTIEIQADNSTESIGYLDYTTNNPSLHYLCTSYYNRFCDLDIQNGTFSAIRYK